MKHIINITLLISVLLLIGCDKSINVKFTSPQPNKTKNLNTFNESYLGDYKYKSDNSFILSLGGSINYEKDSEYSYDSIINIISIHSNFILNKITGHLFIDTADYDNEISLDTLILVFFTRPNYNYTFDSSNLSYDFFIEDTMFYISDTNILRKLKGKYYLNIADPEDETWDVFQMYIEKETLWINSLSSEDAALIKRLTAIKLDYEKSKTTINPPKSVFIKFIKMKGFENKLRLDKI